MEYKIKIITGFREDQQYTVSSEEAHKAYFLFFNPNERGIFNNGVAVRGVDIKSIEPDYQGTMGWNATHELDEDDWNEIRGKNVDRKLREILSQAQEIARTKNQPVSLPLSELIKMKVDSQLGNGNKMIE